MCGVKCRLLSSQGACARGCDCAVGVNSPAAVSAGARCAVAAIEPSSTGDRASASGYDVRLCPPRWLVRVCVCRSAPSLLLIQTLRAFYYVCIG